MVGDQKPNDAFDDRGDDPANQTIVSARGHPASDLHPPSEYVGLRPSYGLLRDGLAESANEASRFNGRHT